MSQSEKPDTEEPEVEGIESVENLDLWNEIPGGDTDPESGVECDPMDHGGRPAYVFAIGSYGDVVLKAQVCTACGMAQQAWTLGKRRTVTNLTVNGPMGAIDSVSNNPTEPAEVVKHDLDDLVDWDDVDAEDPVPHGVALIDGEVHVPIIDEAEEWDP